MHPRVHGYSLFDCDAVRNSDEYDDHSQIEFESDNGCLEEMMNNNNSIQIDENCKRRGAHKRSIQLFLKNNSAFREYTPEKKYINLPNKSLC